MNAADDPKMQAACARAKEAAGGPVALSSRLAEQGFSISSQAISKWLVVPVDRVLAVEKATGVSRHELRPDTHGEAPPAQPESVSP